MLRKRRQMLGRDSARPRRSSFRREKLLVHTGKLDLKKVNDSGGNYVPGLLNVIREMAEQRMAKR